MRYRPTLQHHGWRLILSLSSLFAITLSAPDAQALDPKRKAHQHLHRAWQIEHGLPQNAVSALLQTNDGYLWLGTQEGLVRYDGLRFDIFDMRNVAGLADSGVRGLAEDRTGALWIAGGAGLWRHRLGDFSVFAEGAGLPNRDANCVVAAPDGVIWVGTRGGLARLKDGRFEVWTQQNGLSHDSVLALALDAKNELWVGTAAGLDRFVNGRFESMLKGPAQVGVGVSALLAEPDGTVWAATRGQGVYGFGAAGEQRLVESDPEDNDTTALWRDRHGTLWIGTTKRGLLGRQGSDTIRLNTDHGLSALWVLSLFEDREGSLWVGTRNGGLNRFWDGPFLTMTTEDGLSDNMTWAVLSGSDGSMWVGTDRGVTRFAPDGNVTRIDVLNQAVDCLYESDGAMWAGTERGVSKIEGERVTVSYSTQNGLPHGDVRAVLRDKGGSLWFGTHGGGLARLRQDKPDLFDVFNTSAGLVYDDITAMLEDQDGTIWIGTDQGLSLWREGGLRSYKRAEGFIDSEVYAFYADADGVIWIGTDRGLYRFAEGTFSVFDASVGLPDKAYTVLEDARGHLWLSNNKGIFRVSKAELEARAKNPGTNITVDRYGTQDGMRAVECNHAGGNSAAKAKDGRLWFATIGGVAVIDPNVEIAARPPPVVLTQVLARGKPVTSKEGIWISPPGMDDLAFHYTAPSFLAPESLTFSYRLRGLHDDWHEAGTRRVSHYTNLSPGRYTFEVVARNVDGSTSLEPAVFELELAPIFHQTVPFYIGVVLAAAGVMLFLHFRRVRIHQHRETELEELVRERTEQLREANEKLKQLSFRDSLTGLRNRRFLLDVIEKEVAAVRSRSEPDLRKSNDHDLLFMMIDLDRFKSVNDQHGHAAGDMVLVQAAQLLTQIARTSDIIARWGGEEFLMLARHVGRDAGPQLAERIRRGFEEHLFDLGNGETSHVTCSVGFALFPFVQETPEAFSWDDVLALADQALYAAKNSGRNMWVGLYGCVQTPILRFEHVLRRGVAALIAQDKLRVETSARPDQTLVWEMAR